VFTNFNKGMFGEQSAPKTPEIPVDTDVIFVSDLFASDHVGGAELTSEALISSCPLNIFKLRSNEVTMDVLAKNVDKYWIFGNFTGMNYELIPSIVANMRYSIVEFDYKYCKYRSPEKHLFAENMPCSCQNDMTGKIVSAFMYGSKSLWWMSQRQMEKYHTMFPFLSEKSNTVLSSVFDEEFFGLVNFLREKYKDHERTDNIIIGSTSWIKGVEDSIKYCDSKNMDHEVVWNLKYHDLLEKMASSKSLVFHPKGGDTCPRVVIEAKLLGCELHLNENVQHAKELWFDTDDMLDTESYLYAARNRFWNGIKYDMNYNPKISGYTTTRNCISQKYPFVESIQSLLGFCDEVVVVDGGSSDGTWKKLLKMSEKNEKLRVYKNERDWNSKRHAVFDGTQKALARSLCTGDFCWQQDVDEIVHENDYEKISRLVRELPRELQLLALPVVEYWGRNEKVRVDVNPWKWRLIRNLPHITHGIPSHLRKFDDDGELYSMPGSDGCDYVRSDNYEPIQFSTFYSPEVDNLRSLSWSDQGALNTYENWINEVTDTYPGVHHYSWFNIARKIGTYKEYWSRHWQSLFDIKQDDTSENNMFFDKPWSEVSNEDVDHLSKELEEKMGGWIFHQKIDFNQKSPHVIVKRGHPEIMKKWIRKNK
jgi:glycosyltransferase involved in cell wall biosynthesis